MGVSVENNMLKFKPTLLGQAYSFCYQIFLAEASDALRAKLLTIKEDPSSPLANDPDVKLFIKKVFDVAEASELKKIEETGLTKS